jgi:hypothetical protein
LIYEVKNAIIKTLDVKLNTSLFWFGTVTFEEAKTHLDLKLSINKPNIYILGDIGTSFDDEITYIHEQLGNSPILHINCKIAEDFDKIGRVENNGESGTIIFHNLSQSLRIFFEPALYILDRQHAFSPIQTKFKNWTLIFTDCFEKPKENNLEDKDILHHYNRKLFMAGIRPEMQGRIGLWAYKKDVVLR